MIDPHLLPERLAAAWSPAHWTDVTVVVAVSGGADSVALLRALHALHRTGAGRLIVAHFNHLLRGAESDADEQFVAELAGQLGLEHILGRAARDLAASGGGQGLEGAARQARYEFLTAAANQAGARYVALGHTADDQVETVLFNVLRGTGLAGLAGMPRCRCLSETVTLVRPLLAVPRAAVLGYLAQIGQPHRDDSSNRQEDYTRNRLRRDLLPQLERDYNPRVREALLRLSQIAREADDELSGLADEVLSAAMTPIGGGCELFTTSFGKMSEYFVRCVLMAAWRANAWPLQDMSYEKWEQLAALARHATAAGDSVVQTYPGGVRAQRRGDLLRLTRSTA